MGPPPFLSENNRINHKAFIKVLEDIIFKNEVNLLTEIAKNIVRDKTTNYRNDFEIQGNKKKRRPLEYFLDLSVHCMNIVNFNI
jgi:hypothetical protein